MATSIKVTVTVNAPAQRVWEFFMNPDYLKNWLTGFVSVEQLSGKPGEPGSTSKLRFMERGKQMEVIEKVLRVETGQQYSFQMAHEGLDILTDVRFVSLGQLTEIIQAVQFSPRGIFMKIMMPFIKGEMKRRMGKDLQKLKEFIEGK